MCFQTVLRHRTIKLSLPTLTEDLVITQIVHMAVLLHNLEVQMFLCEAWENLEIL